MRLLAAIWFESEHQEAGKILEVGAALARLLVQANRAEILQTSAPGVPERLELPREPLASVGAPQALVEPATPPRRRR